MSSDLITDGYVGPLIKRRINEATCQHFGYKLVDDFKGSPVQVAPYCDAKGRVVAQKVRWPNKDFRILGDMKEAGLFGQHLWRDKGKKVVITEGELDALSVSQMQDNKWPVVSVPNGAPAAAKAIKKSLAWLCGFEEIILYFDGDEPGIAAAEECAALFPPGRCKIARHATYKDANEALMAGDGKAIIDTIWGAKVWRPDGIMGGEELWEAMAADDADMGPCIVYPWADMQAATLGLRRAEVTTILAGSGVGKSTVVRELMHHCLREGETIGGLLLEETVGRTTKGLISIELSRPLHLDMTPSSELDEGEKAARREAFERMGGCSRLHLYNHFGSTAEDNLINKIRFLFTACGCSYVFLDHLSIVVSGMEDGGDERKLIDRLMTKLRTLVQETKGGLIIVSHLSRPKGEKGHENGAEVSASQARGSHSIIQLSDNVFGLERDQQNEQTKNITTLRLIKCRITGSSGIAGHLLYDRDTGRLREVSANGPTSGSGSDSPPWDTTGDF